MTPFGNEELVSQLSTLVTLFVDEVLEGLLVAVADGDVDVAEDDAVAVDFLDFVFLDDEGAVDADETAGGQQLLHVLHVHQREDGLLAGGGENFHIVLETLDVEDVVEVDLQQFILALDKDAGGFLLATATFLVHQFVPLQCLVAGLEEVGIADGLGEVVERVDAVAIDGILAEGGGEDDARGLGQHLAELQSVEVGHLDVKENEVDGVVGKSFEGVHGVVILALEFHEGDFIDVAGQQFHGQGFVVDDGAFNCHD